MQETNRRTHDIEKKGNFRLGTGNAESGSRPPINGTGQ